MPHDRVSWVRLGGDFDRPLHRIFRVGHFEELFRSGLMTLVQPELWMDPREDPCASFVLTPAPGAGFQKAQRQLADYLSVCWAQCWSTDAQSDLLLRAYSQVELDPETKRNATADREGVRATTTPKRLLAAMERWARSHPGDHFYLAGVSYEEESQFGRQLAGRLLRPEGPLYFGTPDGRAESLCTKRKRFGDEREVRLLCVGPGRLGTGERARRFEIDPNSLFAEVAFDPRLMTFEQRERADALRSAGYEGAIVEDTSYLRVFNMIPMPASWPDPR